MVRSVKSRLTLRFSDGSKVVIDDGVAEELDDIRDKRDPECEFKRYDFYPGQILFGPVRSLEPGDWVECSQELQTARSPSFTFYLLHSMCRKSKPHKGYKMTVEDIEFKSLGVSWICRAYFSSGSGDDGKTEAQPKYKVGQEVRLLDVTLVRWRGSTWPGSGCSMSSSPVLCK